MSPEPLSVVIHGHFYQPPREDPWTGAVPRQPSAAPFHDWNARIDHECYGPVTAAQVPRTGGGAGRTLNALAFMSFDFGPTLLSWMERSAPATYSRVLAADAESRERLGHGNAIAMPYHHPILPLSAPRDRLTEVRWGIADFRSRFGREPEGMWLPEAAVDAYTLETLAAEGIRFTILAPHQVVGAPADGGPGRFIGPSGREIAVFVYDGRLSHAIAFGDLAHDGARWAETIRGAEHRTTVTLRSTATDGETFGHHHRSGAAALATALATLHETPGVTLENYASFLARHPPVAPVELVEPSSWSCAHGVDRWRSDCGCRADQSTDSSQAWRAPLRDALTWLAGEIHRIYEREAAGLITDPWGARDAFGAVAASSDPEARRRFLDAWMVAGSGTDRRGRALELLELEHDALRLFTSCAWFFDDPARLEPKQVLAYAAHAVGAIGGPEGDAVGRELSRRLEAVVSNDPTKGTGADLLRAVTRPRANRGG